jgi:hypothetical protein
MRAHKDWYCTCQISWCKVSCVVQDYKKLSNTGHATLIRSAEVMWMWPTLIINKLL